MECRQAQEIILESFDRGDAVLPPEIAAHLAECPDCAAFALQQKALDARLGAALVPPELSPAFRGALRRRIREEKAAAVSDWLPERVHFLSCGIATALCALLLPMNPSVVLAGGAAATFCSYLLLTAARGLFEEADDPVDSQ